MNGTNYIGAIVRILETPNQKNLKNNFLVTKVRAQLSQRRNPRIVTLIFWGNSAPYTQTNDYFLIEGYFSVRNKKKFDSNLSKEQKGDITVLKFYPI